MRKTPLPQSGSERRSSLDAWLDIEDLAAVEISSEDPAYPFENALRGDAGDGWRAAGPGPQTIRIRFDKPTSVRRIRLEFRDASDERSQEFRLSAVTFSGDSHEIARQQWNFSPQGSNAEVEDYRVSLQDVEIVQLEIDPGRHDGLAVATLQSIAIA